MGTVRLGLRIKVLVGVIALAALTTAVFLNPIRVSYSAKAPTKSIAYDEQISIPKAAGGLGSLNLIPNTLGGYPVSNQARLPSGWAPVENGDDPEILDAFKCSEGTAQKIRLTVHYEDSTHQLYYPWGYASPWRRISPDTALGREMKFVCALQLTSESAKRATNIP